jgi:hypothetical protein
VGVSAVQRIKNGASAVLTNAQGRHEYAARLKWLLRGSGDLQAWSLEYRAGLHGVYEVEARRSNEDPTRTMHCPEDCATGAPLAHLYEARYVYELSDTVVNTVTGAALLCSTPEPPFFIRESISWPFESILSHGLDIPEVKQATPGPSGPATIFGGTGNYYHWLIEEVPLVLRALERDPQTAVLAYRDAITDRHRVIARELGFTITPADRTIRLRHHVLPGRANDSWFIHPRDGELLFELGSRLTRENTTGSDRIYVSRRGASRSLPHEAELEARLRESGFTIINPETLTWPEQIATFRAANVIVAPHGAGLSNLVFSEPGAQVIELTNGRHYNRCFEWLCHVREHRYVPVSSDDGLHPTVTHLHDAILGAIN